MSIFSGPETFNDGLVLQLDTANSRSYLGNGTAWNDLSGKGNNGVLYNGISFSSANKELMFDGINDYAYFPYTATSLDGDPIFTVEAVIKRSANVQNAGYWGISGDAAGKGINSYVYPGQDNKIGLDLWGSATFNCGATYPLNTPVHVVWVKYAPLFSANSFFIYVNGVKYGSSSFVFQRGSSGTPSLDTSAANKGIVLGRVGSNDAGYCAAGSIQMFRIYSQFLTDQQVAQNFEAVRSRYGI